MAEISSGGIRWSGTSRSGLDPARVDIAPLGFARSVQLTKTEVFGACQALADADRALLRTGRTHEAKALGDLFELLEQRLAVVSDGCPRAQASSGRNSIDSELTQ